MGASPCFGRMAARTDLQIMVAPRLLVRCRAQGQPVERALPHRGERGRDVPAQKRPPDYKPVIACPDDGAIPRSNDDRVGRALLISIDTSS